jgi:hypothetical protein
MKSFHVSPGSWPGPAYAEEARGPTGWEEVEVIIGNAGVRDWRWKREAKCKAPLSRGCPTLEGD